MNRLVQGCLMKGTESRGQTRAERGVYKKERRAMKDCDEGRSSRAPWKRREQGFQGNPAACTAWRRMFNLARWGAQLFFTYLKGIQIILITLITEHFNALVVILGTF